ncbi:DUF221-domain-containing protein [Lentithecium fluviatile CBS 122367]|uniref:DUF221-domain-containing protein n=1 Tax=Lentithecium fluviatile CBS 122367 TaxID=1168545 RepID=A0A6G1JA66_9PLEO|nr:DUF221-domain-containing protein [Lentithecium fluviatile CBS 122367]
MASSSSGIVMRADKSIDEKLLELMSNPFGSQVAQDSILVAIGTSLCITAAIFLAFCILRPFNQIVYAPRLRHADEKHRPPPMDKSLFAWWKPVFKTTEQEYMHSMGMDATVFLRIARMCRNMFITLAIVGCGIIIPVNISKSAVYPGETRSSKNIIFLMTPKYLFGNAFWAFVVAAYAFDIVVCGYLWWTYRAIHQLRRKYMESPEYQNSLNARSLMVTDIKKNLRSDQGIVEITDSLRTVPEVPRASIGRNVKDIPDMIEEHEKAVVELEQVLAKYLKNPNSLPAVRPMCKPSKRDPEFTNKNEKVDAIDYLTARIQRLEEKIRQARETVDKRDAMPYGFASYETIESAHTVAFAARSKHPKGSTVQLAPKPKDIIWKNLPLDPKTRRWRRLINRFWITLLTVLYFVPNALIAVFLAQLGNIAILFPDFGAEMAKNPKTWAVVQGIAAPALTSLFYYFLPIIFRRLSVKAGDLTKTSRERHVISQLFSFFVFNNLLVFSLFGAVFKLVIATINIAKEGGRTWYGVLEEVHPFINIMIALCDISPFWVTWLVQRNLGAAIDLSQAVNLGWGSFSRKFLNPTPRELITRTAPPPFDYASYYNYFLFYSTVALCFGSLQPITLVVTAFYFSIDSSMKKYLLLYVFCTKNETGGLYWRTVFNRFLTGTFISNCIIALMIGARGDPRNMMLGAMAPIPLLLIAFKFYCKNTFDNSMKYYTKGESPKGVEAPPPIDKETRRRDRIGVRFGHPALYQKLTVPMVHEKSKHMLSEVYRGRLDGDIGSTAGFSDVYSMKRMSKEHPGKAAGATGPFEFIAENNMDFANFKDRPEFSDEHGGEGSVYGHNSRPGTPIGSERGRSSSRDSQRTFSPEENGVTYPAGYHHTPSNLREYSPSPSNGFGRSQSSVNTPYQIPADNTNLLHSAAPMGNQTPTYSPYTPDQDGGRTDYFRGPSRT